MAMGGFDGSINIDTHIDSTGFNRGVKNIGSGLDGLMSSLKGLAAAVGLAFGIAAIVNFGKASVKASTDLTNAMIGLKSIVDGQGRSFAGAQAFLQKYISDGLIPATDAVTAYKNLAMRGYTDPQIQSTLTALKDSAAFGRQASLTLGQAVSSATEGLKNENSILVDNAGVTKNVSMMWADYAASIGVGVQSLTKQQKIQAEVTGIMQETRFQTDDAAKIANTYSGEVLKLGFNFNNLKIAVGNGLIPMAQAVLPSINAIIVSLTQVANLFAQVTTALFGRQAAQQQNVAKTAGNIASNSNAAAAAQNKLANATKKAAKAADGSTASWDKLNVLQEDTASGGSTAGAASPDTSVSALTGATGNQEIGAGVTVSPAVQAAVDAFNQIIAPLQAIDFTNLNGAFNGLVEAVKPLGKTLFSGLEWAYNNIFMPLAKWTIEDYLPAWLDAFAAEIDVLNSAIDALKPLGIWLWDNFLKPLAEWTGGAIVGWLNFLADSMKKISDWIDNNQGLVQGMTITVGLFFAAWEVSNLLEFITNAGGVIGILGSMTGAIWAATGAKIADKAETLYLIGLYAKDFVVSLAQGTAALIKNVAQWVIATAAKVADTIAQWAATAATAAWNAICVIASAVTWAFGAAIAFLTSPIGLVILAIVAIIAIVVLLIKHWDQVKAAAAACWAWIVSVWNSAGAWFNSNVIQPIMRFFSGLRSSIQGIFGGIGNWFRGVFQSAADGIRWAFSSIGSFFQGIWNTIRNMFSNIGTTIGNSIGGAFKSVVNSIINFAENTINGFIRAINGAIGMINYIPGVNISTIREMRIPRLATGAVIPPRAEFATILGDQRSGTNIEAPEGLIRSIVSDELSKIDFNPQVVVRASGSDSALIRWMKFEIEKEDNRVGTKFATGGGRI